MNLIIRGIRCFLMLFVGLYFRLTKSCKVHFSVFLNFKTSLEGYNKIGQNSSISNTIIGYSSYIANNCVLTNCIIGKYCSIGNNVKVISATHPTSIFVSTHPAFYSTAKQIGYTFVTKDLYDEHLFFDKEKRITVKIGNDVWIGNDVTIVGGCKIGDGAIIGTGALVTKDVEPYNIVGGVPSHFIKLRFTPEEIDFLLHFEWWNKSHEWLLKNVDKFSNIKKFRFEVK